MRTIWLWVVIVLVVFSLNSIVIRNRRMYLQGRMSRMAFARNVLLEIIGILIAMTIAGLIYKWIAEAFIVPLPGGEFRFILNITAALSIGAAVGLLMKWTWGKLIN